MVYGFVVQSGGAVQVHTAPGAGTDMRLYLPLLRRAPERRATPPPATLAGGSETVLLVEDDALVRALAVRVLVSAGYTVLEASSPSEALRQADQPFELLLTDVLLPEMNGWVLSRRILERRPSARVLLMSGYAGDRLDGDPIVPGDSPLLQKPFTPEQLLAQVRAALSPWADATAPGEAVG
jgi:two-component system, cell cycle sensor histidine kinase and response regulator CckA